MAVAFEPNRMMSSPHALKRLAGKRTSVRDHNDQMHCDSTFQHGESVEPKSRDLSIRADINAVEWLHQGSRKTAMLNSLR